MPPRSPGPQTAAAPLAIAQPPAPRAANARRESAKLLFAALQNGSPLPPELIGDALPAEPSAAGRHALRLAVEHQRLDAIALLLPRSDENARADGELPLIRLAAQRRLPKILSILLDARDPADRNGEAARAFLDLANAKRSAPPGTEACLRLLLPFWSSAWTIPHSASLEHLAANLALPGLLKDILARADASARTLDNNNQPALACAIFAGRDPLRREGALACVRQLLPLSEVFGRGHFGHDALRASCHPGLEAFVEAILGFLSPGVDWQRELIDDSLRSAAKDQYWGCADALSLRASAGLAARIAEQAPGEASMPRWRAAREAQALREAVSSPQPDSGARDGAAPASRPATRL